MGFYAHGLFYPNKRISHMKKIETITPRELKKIMKLSIAIDMELGFYIAYCQRTIAIDRYNNWDSNKTKIYSFSLEDMHKIFTLVNAYARLYKRNLSLR